MKYLNKTFTVPMQYRQEPKCSACLKSSKVLYNTVQGYFCSDCYNQRKKEDTLKKIKDGLL